MIADCAFFTGSTHPVCQDYARCGKGEHGPYVLIADGCSSSPDTDIGARILVMSALRFINVPDPEKYHTMAVIAASDRVKDLGLPQTSLDATLLTIRIEKGVPVAMIYGDGYIATRKNGIITAYKISYPNNTPNYVSYQLLQRSRIIGKLQPGVVEEFRFGPDGMSHEGIGMVEGLYIKQIDADCDFVAVMSDGAASFLRPVESETSKMSESVPAEEIIPQLLGFKMLQTGFVERRLKRMIKDIREKNWQHYDDLSVGAVALKVGGKDAVLPDPVR